MGHVAEPTGAALFAHDHVFVRREGRVYTQGGKLPVRAFDRYLEEFATVSVLARGTDNPDLPTPERDRADSSRVYFDVAVGYSGPRDLLLRRRELRRRVDAVLARHDALIARLPSELGLIAIECAHRQGKPWAVEVVGCAWDAYWNYGGFPGKVYAPLALRRMQRAVARSRWAIYVTREFLQRRYPSRGNVAAASNVEIRLSSAEAPVRRTIDQRAPVLGLIGSLETRYKGVDVAIKALAWLRAEHPEARLKVLGTGDPGPWQAEAQRAGVLDAITFCGTLPAGDAVLNWLDELDIYVQPSFQEGLPRALIEAMSRGLPAAGSTAGGIPELLPAELLHRPGDAEGLARALGRLIGEPEYCAAQGRHNRSIAVQYDADKLTEVRRRFWRGFAAEARGIDART